jgi:hypothetical protein
VLAALTGRSDGHLLPSGRPVSFHVGRQDAHAAGQLPVVRNQLPEDDDWLSPSVPCDACGTPAYEWELAACTRARLHYVLRGPGYTPDNDTPFRVPAVIAALLERKNTRIAAIERNQTRHDRAESLLFTLPKDGHG